MCEAGDSSISAFIVTSLFNLIFYNGVRRLLVTAFMLNGFAFFAQLNYVKEDILHMQ